MIKLFEAELKVMELLWEHGAMPAADVAKLMNDETGWNKNTTYTVLKKLVAKGALMREEPHFICAPLITKEQVRHQETQELIDKMYNGSSSAFFASFLKQEALSQNDVDELRAIIDRLK